MPDKLLGTFSIDDIIQEKKSPAKANPQADVVLETFSVDDILNEPKRPDAHRNVLQDFGAGLAAGVVDTVKMGAQMARHGDEPYEHPIASKIIEETEKLEETNPLFRPSVEAQRSDLRRSIYEGTRMAVPSVTAGVPGAVAGSMVGGIPGAATVAGMSGAAVFGVAEYDQFMSDIRDYEQKNNVKLDPDLVNSKALKSALVEGGFEGLSNVLDVVAAKIGGRAVDALRGIAKKYVKTGAAELTAGQFTKNTAKQIGKDFVGSTALAMPGEIGTEMAQSYLETKFRNDVGLQAGDPVQAAKDVVGPTAFMTFMFGVGATGYNAHNRRQIAKALQDEKTNPKTRQDAVLSIASELDRYDKKTGTDYAKQWLGDAQQAVINGQPIRLDENVINKYGPGIDKNLKRKGKEPPAPAPEPTAEAPQPQVAPDSAPGEVVSPHVPEVEPGPPPAPPVTMQGEEEEPPIQNLPEPEQVAGQFSDEDLDNLLDEETNTEPSDKQKEAGNYKKAHMDFHGLDISIENPKGSTRSGTDKSGKAWETTMQHHYGYIKGTVGKDKDHLDVFIGPDLESQNAFVVNQVNPETGKFDEHKIMLGFQDEATARQGYLDNYEEGWKGLGSIHGMTLDDLKAWTKEGDTKKEFAPKAQIFTGKTPLSGNKYGASIGSLSEGTKKQLMIDPEGGYFWGDYKEGLNVETMETVKEGEHRNYSPALFENSKQAREAAETTTQDTIAPKTSPKTPQDETDQATTQAGPEESNVKGAQEEQAPEVEQPKTKDKLLQKLDEKQGSRRLKTDYGVDEINGYDSKTESPSGPIKKEFLDDAKTYLLYLNKHLGWEPPATKKNKTGVMVNEAGPAVSGDVIGIFFKPGENHGIYVNISGSGLSKSWTGNKGPVSIMYRTCTKERPYSGEGPNRWASNDLSVSELADLIRNEVDSYKPKAKEQAPAPKPKVPPELEKKKEVIGEPVKIKEYKVKARTLMVETPNGEIRGIQDSDILPMTETDIPRLNAKGVYDRWGVESLMQWYRGKQINRGSFGEYFIENDKGNRVFFNTPEETEAIKEKYRKGSVDAQKAIDERSKPETKPAPVETKAPEKAKVPPELERKPKEPEDLSKKSTGDLVSDIFSIINDHIGERGSFSAKTKELDETLYQKIKPYLLELAGRAKKKALDVKAYLMGAVDSMPEGKAKDIYEQAAEKYIEEMNKPAEAKKERPVDSTNLTIPALMKRNGWVDEGTHYRKDQSDTGFWVMTKDQGEDFEEDDGTLKPELAEDPIIMQLETEDGEILETKRYPSLKEFIDSKLVKYDSLFEDGEKPEDTLESKPEPVINKNKEEGGQDERTGDGSTGQGSLEENGPGNLSENGERQRPRGGKRGGGKADAEGNADLDEGGPDGAGGLAGEQTPIHLHDEGSDRGELSAELEDQSTPVSEPRSLKLSGDNPGNYRITPEDNIGSGTRGVKIDRNMAAIRLVKQLEQEKRYPTKEEQGILAKYVGWGGLKSVFDKDSSKPQDIKAREELEAILTKEEYMSMFLTITDAHYTSPEVIGSIYDVLRHMGFEGGNVLEPTYGSGNFIGLMPEDMSASSKWYGSELDPITAKIGQFLYPESQLIESGFQVAEFPFGKFDLAIGNPPFGDTRIADVKKNRAAINRFKIHNYVIAKEGMHLKPGGILANVATTRFLDTADPEARAFLAKSFKFLGAIRLPNDAFAKNAGTTVTTDIIFLQRLMPDEKPDMNAAWLTTGATMENKAGEIITLNKYFADKPYMMLGEPSMKGTMYGGKWKEGGPGEFTLEKIEGQDTSALIKELIEDRLESMKGIVDHRANDKADAAALSLTVNKEDVGIGGFYAEGDSVYMRGDDDAYGNPTFEKLTVDTPWSSSLVPDGMGGYTRVVTKDKKKETVHYRSAKEVPATLKLGETKLNRIKGMLSLREKAYKLIEAERFDLDDIEALRKDLNKAYDSFVKHYGYLSEPANFGLMSDDVKIEFGLEMGYKKEITAERAKALGIKPMPAVAQKASILTKRVFFPAKEIIFAKDVTDGYGISLSQKGRLDVEYIAGLTGKTVDEVTAELSELGLAYQDPETNAWIQEDEYLSGNVKAKHKKAVEYGLDKNAAALQKVFPPDKPAERIYAGIGATWIPIEAYKDFGRFIGVDNPDMMISHDTGKVLMSGKEKQNDVNVSWVNQDYGVVDLFNAAAGHKTLVAYDGFGDDRTVNKERTKGLSTIVKSLKNTFDDWLMADDTRAKAVVKEYNETQNTHAKRKYDGAKLHTVGASPGIVLRNTQRNAAWRMIQSPIVLLDHVVGSGKTFTIITGIMERVRMGLTRKAMIVVPNHLVGQWAADWMKMYPGARILAATNKDFTKANRRRLFSRITTGNYDAVIVGHSSFGFIPIERQTLTGLIMEEVAHLERAEREARAAGEKRIATGLAKRIQKKRERITELTNKPRDNVSHFEQMGIDHLVVDESHEFKNLEYSSAMQNITGMGNPAGSKRAFDLYSKIRHLSGIKGTGITFATGTPISNSLVEMYAILRYLNRQGLVDRKLEAFDAWASAYASTENKIEYTASQKLKDRVVMATFKNIRELVQLYEEFADSITMDDLKRIYAEQIREMNRLTGGNQREEFPIPKVDRGGRQLDVAAADESQATYVDYLVARAQRLEDLGRQNDPTIDNHLWLMGDARKMALDIRLVDPEAKAGKNNKIARSAKKIKAIYDKWHKDKGTQLVFCDLSTPAKTAQADAKKFIKTALTVARLDKDRAVQNTLDGMGSFRDKWGYIRHRIDAEIEAINESREAETAAFMQRREQLEEFLNEKASDSEVACLTTADTGFSVYDELKATLVKMGIPAGEIRFIHEANTAPQKDELFGLVNAGAVRVLIGSTPKMGAGTNAQERMVALHHLDAPWRPSDVEQREGRLVRQGNSLYERDPDGFLVEIFAYSTGNTFDAVMWQILSRKQEMLNDFRSGKDVIEEGSSDSASYADFMAETTGNPAFKEKFKLEGEIEELRSAKNRIKTRRRSAEQSLAFNVKRRANLTRDIEQYEQARAAVDKIEGEAFTYNGKEYVNDIREEEKKERSRLAEINSVAAVEHEKKHSAILEKIEKKWPGVHRGFIPGKLYDANNHELTKEETDEINEWYEALLKDAGIEHHPKVIHFDREKLARANPDGALAAALKIRKDVNNLPKEDGGEVSFIVGGANVTIEATPSGKKDDKGNSTGTSDYEIFVDGVLVGSNKDKGALPWETLEALLSPSKLRADIDENIRNAKHWIESDENDDKVSRQTLDKLQFTDEENLKAKEARYAELVVEVNNLEAEMEERRAGSINKYISGDRNRFGAGYTPTRRERKEAPKPKEEPKPEPVYLDQDKEGLLDDAYTFRRKSLKDRLAQRRGEPEDKAVFNRVSPASSGSARDIVYKGIEPVWDSWSNCPDIQIVNTVAELPKGVMDQALSAPGQAQGVFVNGRVYLIAENIGSAAEAQGVLLHEVIGHWGLRATFGKDMERLLNDAFLLMSREQKERIANLYGLDLKNKGDQWTCAEEYIAHHAGVTGSPTLWNRFVSTIKAWLRKAGFTIDPTDAELRTLVQGAIKKSRELVEGKGRGQEVQGSAAASRKADVWYSQLQKAVESSKFPAKAPGAQMAQALESWAKTGDIKQEELDWSGVSDWLRSRQHEKVTREQVLDYLRANNVQIQEVTKGGEKTQPIQWSQDGKYYKSNKAHVYILEVDPEWFELHVGNNVAEFKTLDDAKAEAENSVDQGPPATKYSGWQTPGGENYRELLLTLPIPDKAFQQYEAYEEAPGAWTVIEKGKPDGSHIGRFRGTDARERAEADAVRRNEHAKSPNQMIMAEGHDGSGIYQSSHFDEPNILAHVRFNERTDADGKRVLFIEEIQSDWHQAGRKKGYKSDTRPTDEEVRKFFDLKDNDYVRDHLEDYRQEMMGHEAYKRGQVPNAPFKKTWPMLAFKRMVRYAAENGFDRIAWTTGEQQAERYDLSHHVKEVAWTTREAGDKAVGIFLASGQKYPQLVVGRDGAVKEGGQFTGKPLSEVIGKEISQKILDGEKGSLSGLDLKVGGEGMKGFYDKILPAEVNKFFGKGKWGNAKVGETIFGSKFEQLVEWEKPKDWSDMIDALERYGDSALAVEEEDGNIKSFDEFDFRIHGDDEYDASRKIDFVLNQGYSSDSIIMKKPSFSAHSLDITPEMKEKAMLEGMPMFKRAEAAPTTLDNKSLFPEVQARLEASRGVGKQLPLKEKILAKAEEIWHSWRRHFPHLDPEQHGKFMNILRLFENVPTDAKRRARDLIKDILGSMKTEAEYDIFSYNVILEDMLKDLDSGLLDVESLQEGETLPFGYTSREQVEQDLAHFKAQADRSEGIRQALDKRNAQVQKMREDLVEYGLLDESRLDDPAYFHHQVLEMWGIRKWAGTGTSTKDVRTHKKGWQIARTGSLKDYNTEYMESEFEVMAQSIAQIETKKTLDRIDREANIIKSLRHEAKRWNLNRCMDLFEERGQVERREDQETGEIIIQTPFTPYEQKIAIGFSKLQRMAEDGELEGPDKFSDTIDAIAEGGRDPQVFQYLAWLLQTGSNGAREAAMIFKGIKGKEALVKETLGDELKTFKAFIPEDHRIWKPEPNTAWYLTNSLTDKVLEQIVAGEKRLDDAEVRKVLARGVDAMWVIPSGLADTLDDFRPHRDEGPVGKASVFLVNSWKQWVLINPLRVVKYNLNNMSGDIDICFAYDPRIIKDYMMQAGKDLHKYFYNKEISHELKRELDESFKAAILSSGMTVNDITDITEHMTLDGYLGTMMGRDVNAISKYWNSLKNFTVYRENILRLAAYRYFKDRINNGDQVYGASNQSVVNKITNRTEKAALLARELVGDYGNLSVAGQWLRTKMIPFWSWCEINAPRYIRMFYNLPEEGRGREALAGMAAKSTIQKAAGLALKCGTLYGLIMLWNLTMFPDYEKELGEMEKKQLHLILGKRPDGSIVSIRLQGALSDALSWLGLENFVKDIEDLASGRKTPKEQGKEMILATPNRLVNASHPFIKAAAETMTGYSLFPDISHPRPIKDKVEHLARVFSLESPYRHLTGKPTRGDWSSMQFWDDVINVVGYSSDPGEAAYFDTRERARVFLERNGLSAGSYQADSNSKSMALYNYKKALQYGDLDVAKKYHDQYMSLGGDKRGMKASIRLADPRAAIPKNLRWKFINSLTPQDREKYNTAIKWYKEVYGGQGHGSSK